MWQLKGVFDYAPQWSAHATLPDIGEDSDSDEFGSRGNKGRKKKTLAITAGNASSDGSMPGLQSVSNTSDDDDGDDDDSEYETEYESSDDGYNTEEEDEIREMYREAMDAAHEADWFDANVPAGVDPFLQEDRKGNPFLKILGSLRGLF